MKIGIMKIMVKIGMFMMKQEFYKEIMIEIQ